MLQIVGVGVSVSSSGSHPPPTSYTSLLAGPAWCPCSWLGGTEEVLCQAFTYPWVGFSPRLPYLQRSGDHDDRKTQRRQYSPRLQKGARGAVRTPPSHRPYNGRSLSAPCYTPCGGHMTSKNGHCGDVFTGGTRSFCSAGLVTARGFCVILEGAAPTPIKNVTPVGVHVAKPPSYRVRGGRSPLLPTSHTSGCPGAQERRYVCLVCFRRRYGRRWCTTRVAGNGYSAQLGMSCHVYQKRP